ncbi:MAG: monooxygenase [Hyphomicrobiaceae bacterium]|nr:monooxygenase [Hyphomicrobiaceae bacterium]
MIIAVVQIPMPKRPKAAAIAAQTKSAPTFRALADKGLLRKDYLNGDAGGGGVYTWTSREAAEAWYTPEWLDKAEKQFGARPTVTYYETYVTVDNVKGETVVREG